MTQYHHKTDLFAQLTFATYSINNKINWMETTVTDARALAATIVLNNWEAMVNRSTSVFNALSDEQLWEPVSPGKNRGIYLLGHLIAIHDKAVELLGIGERRYEKYDVTFIESPDGAATSLPDINQLRNAWKELHQRINERLTQMPVGAWFEKHNAVSEEDFAKQPDRNKMALLLTRTTHLAYHYGQVLLLK